MTDWCTKVERAKEDGRALATVTSLDTPGAESVTPGDVTPQQQTQQPGAIPIPLSSLHPQPQSPLSPVALPIGGPASSSYATSISPQTPFSTTLSSSALSSSYTSTSTNNAQGGPTDAPRVPPNSFAVPSALGLHVDQRELELGTVDAGLESLLGSQQLQQRSGSFSGTSAGGGTSSGGEGTSRLTVPPSPGYFSSRGGNYSAGSPSSPGAGMVSSSEDDDGYDSFSQDAPGPVLVSGPGPTRQLSFQDGTKMAAAEPTRTGTIGKSSDNVTDQPATFIDPNKVILSGYLMKQGKRRNWRKRWFVLQSGGLTYSRSHMVRPSSLPLPSFH